MQNSCDILFLSVVCCNELKLTPYYCRMSLILSTEQIRINEQITYCKRVISTYRYKEKQQMENTKIEGVQQGLHLIICIFNNICKILCLFSSFTFLNSYPSPISSLLSHFDYLPLCFSHLFPSFFSLQVWYFIVLGGVLFYTHLFPFSFSSLFAQLRGSIIIIMIPRIKMEQGKRAAKDTRGNTAGKRQRTTSPEDNDKATGIYINLYYNIGPFFLHTHICIFIFLYFIFCLDVIPQLRMLYLPFLHILNIIQYLIKNKKYGFQQKYINKPKLQLTRYNRKP